MAAQAGDTVQIHYTGTLDDGSTFDSSEGREPLSFTLGSGQVIQGFDDAVTGMEVGESKTVRIPANEAYGEARADLILDMPRDQVPPDVQLELGMQLSVQQQNSQAEPVTVVEITDNTVKLDANHALAGQALTFALELVAVN